MYICMNICICTYVRIYTHSMKPQYWQSWQVRLRVLRSNAFYAVYVCIYLLGTPLEYFIYEYLCVIFYTYVYVLHGIYFVCACIHTYNYIRSVCVTFMQNWSRYIMEFHGRNESHSRPTDEGFGEYLFAFGKVYFVTCGKTS